MNYFDYIADPTRDCAVIAHRGIWQSAPENSLLAIERAIEGGYDVVEIDVRRSADGELFLLHDDTLGRMVGLARSVEAMSADELRGLRLRDRNGGEAHEVSDQKLPSLEDVFALTRNRILLHLDVKDRSIIAEVIACAQAMGVERQVDFWASLATPEDLNWILAEIAPHGVPFIAKSRLNVPTAALQMDLVLALAPPICEIYFDSLDQLAQHQSQFADAGIALWVNTLDDVSCAGLTDTAALQDPETVWGKLIDAGISAIQTDAAEALKAFIAARRP